MTRVDLVLSWLVTYALHSTLLLGGAWLVSRRLGQAHAVREVIWKLALVGGMVTATAWTARRAGTLANVSANSPANAAAAPLLQVENPPLETEAAVAEADLSNAKPLQSADADVPETPAPVAAAPLAPDDAPFRLSVPSAGAALLLWLSIAGGLLAFYVLSWRRLVTRLSPRTPVTDPAWLHALESLQKAAGLRRPIRLTASNRLSSPVALGVGEICVPTAALAGLDPEQRRSIVAHELAHLARFDPLWLGVGCVVERALFFQPLNRVARRALQDTAEFLSDDWAVRRTGSGLTLAKCLVKVAEWIDTSPQPVPVSGMAERRSQLVSRIHRLIENRAMQPQPRRRWLIPAAVGLLAITAAVAPGVTALQAPQGQAPADTTTSLEAQMRRLQRQSRTLQRTAERQAVRAMATIPRVVPIPPIAPIAPMPPMAPRELRGVRAFGDGRHQGDTTSAAVPALIEALKDPEVAVRRAAAASLGNLEDPRALAGLITATRDADAEVRTNALEALGNLEDGRATSAIAAALKDASADVRHAAIEALVRMPGEKPVEPLLGALDDSDAQVRQMAIDGLMSLEPKDKRAVAPLIKLLGDPSADVRQEAAQALGEMQAPEAANPLAALLKDSNADVRETAANALGELSLTQAPPALLDALKDKNADVRQAAVCAVGQIRDPRAVPALRTLLQDPNADVREHVVDALSEIRDSAALDALIGALKSNDREVRRQAAEALGQRQD